jgi:hypothetical protein
MLWLRPFLESPYLFFFFVTFLGLKELLKCALTNIIIVLFHLQRDLSNKLLQFLGLLVHLSELVLQGQVLVEIHQLFVLDVLLKLFQLFIVI